MFGSCLSLYDILKQEVLMLSDFDLKIHICFSDMKYEILILINSDERKGKYKQTNRYVRNINYIDKCTSVTFDILIACHFDRSFTSGTKRLDVAPKSK